MLRQNLQSQWLRRSLCLRLRLCLRLFALCCLWSLLGTAQAYADQDVEVIANTSAGVQVLSLQELRTIFTLKLKRWPNGTPLVVVALPKDNPLHEAFSKKILQVFPYQMEKHWDRLVYSGMSQGPRRVNSEQEMLDVISHTPGAIGYAPAATLSANILHLKVVP